MQNCFLMPLKEWATELEKEAANLGEEFDPEKDGVLSVKEATAIFGYIHSALSHSVMIMPKHEKH